MSEERFLTVGEVAERLRTNPETVRRWLRAGELHGFTLGDRGGWRIRESALEAFIRHREGRHNAD